MTLNAKPYGPWRRRTEQTISKDQAVPYIVNFTMVDVDGDGNITADEFQAACGKGLVKNTQ